MCFAGGIMMFFRLLFAIEGKLEKKELSFCLSKLSFGFLGIIVFEFMRG